MSLSRRHISLALVDHLEIWFCEMPLYYIWNTVNKFRLNPQKINTKVYFMLMQVTQ